MSPFDETATAPAVDTPQAVVTATPEQPEPSTETVVDAQTEPAGAIEGDEPKSGDPAPETGEQEPEGNEKAEPTGENVSGPEEPAASSGNSIPLRLMKAGTKLKLGATEVVLYKDAWFTYPEAENEPHFAATCQMTGNYEINAAELEAQYDLNGRVIEG